MRHLEDKKFQYLRSLAPTENEWAKKARAYADQLNLGMISLSPPEAGMLSFFTKALQCHKFIEIGTLTGLSGLYILEALPAQGKLWSFEKNPQHASFAKEILPAFAQSQNKQVEIVIGDAEEMLLSIEKDGPFDGIFIDGNKAAYGTYLAWAEKNLKKGGLIIADNVFLNGGVWGDPTDSFGNNQISVMKEFNQRLSQPQLFDSIFLPTQEGLSISVLK